MLPFSPNICYVMLLHIRTSNMSPNKNTKLGIARARWQFFLIPTIFFHPFFSFDLFVYFCKAKRILLLWQLTYVEPIFLFTFSYMLSNYMKLLLFLYREPVQCSVSCDILQLTANKRDKWRSNSRKTITLPHIHQTETYNNLVVSKQLSHTFVNIVK